MRCVGCGEETGNVITGLCWKGAPNCEVRFYRWDKAQHGEPTPANTPQERVVLDRWLELGAP